MYPVLGYCKDTVLLPFEELSNKMQSWKLERAFIREWNLLVLFGLSKLTTMTKKLLFFIDYRSSEVFVIAAQMDIGERLLFVVNKTRHEYLQL